MPFLSFCKMKNRFLKNNFSVGIALITTAARPQNLRPGGFPLHERLFPVYTISGWLCVFESILQRGVSDDSLQYGLYLSNRRLLRAERRRKGHEYCFALPALCRQAAGQK